MDTNDKITVMISSKLKQIISKQHLSQARVASLCNLSQGTVSNAITKPESMTLATLIKLCAGLNLDMAELLASNPISIIEEESSSFIFDVTDMAYAGYLGKYHIYFIPTGLSTSSDYLHGILTFDQTTSTHQCQAFLHLDTGDKKDDIPVIKEYMGNLIISKRQRCAYCTLYSNILGEICLLVFNHEYLNANPLYCTIANALTASAGLYRYPTAHRICLSREELKPHTIRHLIGELLLINDKFFISEKKIRDFMSSSALPEFKEIVRSITEHQKNKYYLLSESELHNNLPDAEFAHNISLLKSFSEALPNSKITPNMENLLFTLIKTEQQKK